LEGGEASAQVG